MKVIFFFTFMFFTLAAFAQVTTVTGDSDSLKRKVEQLEKEKDSLQKQLIKERNGSPGAGANQGSPVNMPPEKNLGWGWLLVLLPVVLGVFTFNYIMRWLKKDGFKLSDAVSATPVPVAPAAAPAGGVAGTPPATTPPPPPVPSTSRLIAFLSGIAAIVMALCFTTYFAYFSLIDKPSGITAFKDLWPILASMGIGVIPYAVNVWGGNAKEK